MDFAKSVVTHSNIATANAWSSGITVTPFAVAESGSFCLCSDKLFAFVVYGGFPTRDEVVSEATFSNSPLPAKDTYCLTTSDGVSGRGEVSTVALEQVKKPTTPDKRTIVVN